jgi:tetrahydromethanopterin S-methyltransferase subunit C
MKTSATKLVLGLSLLAVGVAFAAAGFYVANSDDAPGAALLGILLMVGAWVLGVRTFRRRA